MLSSAWDDVGMMVGFAGEETIHEFSEWWRLRSSLAGGVSFKKCCCCVVNMMSSS